MMNQNFVRVVVWVTVAGMVLALGATIFTSMS